MSRRFISHDRRRQTSDRCLTTKKIHKQTTERK